MIRNRIEGGVTVKFKHFDLSAGNGTHRELVGLWVDNVITYIEGVNGFGSYSMALVLVGKEFHEVNHTSMELLEETLMTRKD